VGFGAGVMGIEVGIKAGEAVRPQEVKIFDAWAEGYMGVHCPCFFDIFWCPWYLLRQESFYLNDLNIAAALALKISINMKMIDLSESQDIWLRLSRILRISRHIECFSKASHSSNYDHG
jgi:hypothetical protein